MSSTIIKVENLGKSYLIGHEQQKGYVALRDVMANKAKNFVKGIKDTIGGRQLMGDQEVEEFWALKDISFEIKQGDAIGIIGKNGAGKSTLLKILSRITEPTKGRIELNGRVASLLEVGTGFHPELSGRENIYLNGAILGMQRAEIKNKFDEIVDFSGVEKFLDTPVKRYSSGMYVRLAFAVAAHLEPEILVVDEVLAVGDTEFQKKCLGKMNAVSKQGRTVLFVSHQMGTIAQLCNKCILLKSGQLFASGNPVEIIDKYLSLGKTEDSAYTYSNAAKQKKIWISEVATINQEGFVTTQFGIAESIHLKCKVLADIEDNGTLLSVTLQDNLGYYISTSVFELNDLPGTGREKDFYIQMPANIIAPNSYYFRLALFKKSGQVYDLIENICPIKINDTGSKMSIFEGINYGHTMLDFKILNTLQ